MVDRTKDLNESMSKGQARDLDVKQYGPISVSHGEIKNGDRYIKFDMVSVQIFGRIFQVGTQKSYD